MSALAARVAAVVPCKDEAERIAATVAAVAALPQVGRVVVVDDGSSDGTAEAARAAGADVVRHERNRGKAAALETGVRRVRELEHADAVADPTAAWPAALLFVDGDLQETATNLGVLTTAVLDGTAAMTIATLPAQITAGGGRGLVVGLARRGIEHLTGFRAVQPLSGMRCVSPLAFEAASPLARGWGVETALTIDVLRAGLTVLEVPCELQHRVSGRDWRGQVHRAAQYRDVWLALVRRGWRPWHRGLTRAHRLCVGVALGLLLLVGLSAPNAAQPDLAPPGWVLAPRLPLELGPGAVTAVLWTAYLVGALAVYLGLHGRVEALRTWLAPGILALAALLAAPFGSADHVNYLAYGRILVMGGNPWVDAPITWAGGLDPVTSRVEAPWTTEPSVYGPFGTLLHGLSAWVGGSSLREGVWVWQLLVVLSWLAVRALLRAVLDPDLHGRVDVLWTLNPLVVGIGVLGAHIDVVATALALAAVVVAARMPGWTGAALSGVLVALAGSTKFTYAVVAVGVVAAWWVVGHRSAVLARLVGALAAGAVVVGGALHLWAGPHVYDQLLRSRQAVSLATPWRPLLEWGRDTWGNGPTRTLISLAAAVLAVLLAWCLLRISRPAVTTFPPGAEKLTLASETNPGDGEGSGAKDAVGSAAAIASVALWVTACLALAYSLAAPYSLPWYDLLVWCALPAVLPGLVDLVALVRLAALAIAYVPGRVLGLTPTVEDLTLGVRRGVVPWVGLVLWVVVIAAGVRSGSARPLVLRRAGTTPTPTR